MAEAQWHRGCDQDLSEDLCLRRRRCCVRGVTNVKARRRRRKRESSSERKCITFGKANTGRRTRSRLSRSACQKRGERESNLVRRLPARSKVRGRARNPRAKPP